MFDGGLNLDLRNMLKTAHFAVILAILGFIVSVLIVTLFAHYGLDWEWFDSILLASMVGGSSSLIVFGLVRQVRVSEETRTMLSCFDSALTDVLATVMAFIMFDAILSGYLDIELLGLGVGIPWMFVTTKLANAQHSYMLTLGILFVLYFLALSFGESGALTALVFGLMLEIVLEFHE
jgi:cell volume regulation protein A